MWPLARRRAADLMQNSNNHRDVSCSARLSTCDLLEPERIAATAGITFMEMEIKQKPDPEINK